MNGISTGRNSKNKKQKNNFFSGKKTKFLCNINFKIITKS